MDFLGGKGGPLPFVIEFEREISEDDELDLFNWGEFGFE